MQRVDPSCTPMRLKSRGEINGDGEKRDTRTNTGEKAWHLLGRVGLEDGADEQTGLGVARVLVDARGQDQAVFLKQTIDKRSVCS